MISRILILLGIIFFVFVFIRWFTRANPKNVAAILKKVLFWGILAIVVLLGISGRLHWLFALIGSAIAFLPRLLPLLRYVPIIKILVSKFGNTAKGKTPTGQTSHVSTQFLDMTLNHDNGDLIGTVVRGRFEGKKLCELSIDELLSLLRELIEKDPQSVALLESYLDKNHGDGWRDKLNSEQDRFSSSGSQNSQMTKDQACEILNISDNANREEIIAAHKKMMSKMHPDKGGSNYIASQINQAKELLLKLL